MSVGRICVRSVVVAAASENLREAARRMRDAEVGTLVVLDEGRRPLGIITDRDLVVRCLAESQDPDRTPLAQVMSAPVASIRETTSIEEGLAEMGRRGVRRLAVVGDDDRLVGLLALDDVLELLAEESATIGRLLARRKPEP